MDNGKGAGITSADVKAQAREFGADLVNISSCEGYEKALPGCKPEDLVKDAKSVVVFARRMPFGNATPRPSVGYLEFGYYGHEAWINKLSYRLALWLEDEGHMALPTPAGRDIPSLRILSEGAEPEVFMQGSFDLRLAAVNAGMGEIGVNNNLITAEYGSRLRLGAVVTTAALEPDTPKQYGVVPDFCVECGYKCIKPCPAHALPGDGAVDHYKCMVMYPQKVSSEKAVDVFKTRYGYPELQLAGRMMSFTENAPHICATCITLCPMDEARRVKEKANGGGDGQPLPVVP